MAQTLEDKIISVMKKEGKPLRPGDIAELAKADKDQVTKAIKKLSTEGKVKSPKRCFWESI